jgi:signal transduction histidine kinase
MTESTITSEFLANMSHELRTPLGVITGFAELLEERLVGDLNAKQEEYVRDILESARHLLNLINDLLDLSEVEAGKAELELSSVAIASLLDESLVMVKERCRTRQIALSLDIPEPVKDLVIPADERRLKQVLYNLLSNAVKFTPDGGAITLSARLCDDASPLHPSPLPGSPSCIQVSVSDTGLGVAREHQEKVFDQFSQVAGGARGETPGAGLGLALTWRLVELHGGAIWLESEGEGKGSTFHVALPVRQRSSADRVVARHNLARPAALTNGHVRAVS